MQMRQAPHGARSAAQASLKHCTQPSAPGTRMAYLASSGWVALSMDASTRLPLPGPCCDPGRSRTTLAFTVLAAFAKGSQSSNDSRCTIVHLRKP